MPAPSSLLVVALAPRGPSRLDWPVLPGLVGPSRAAINAALSAAPAAERLWLGGGEPTLRPDLPQIIEDAVARLGIDAFGLDTDGLALANPAVLKSLQRLGLRHLRIALHAGRAEAHDWLVGLPGAARRARQAIEVARSAGMQVAVKLCLTRPTMDLLPETVGLLGRLGVSRLQVQRLRRRGPAAAAFVTLSPRIGLLEPILEAAAQRAREAGMDLRIEGLPRCAGPRLPAAGLATHFECEHLPEDAGLTGLAAALAPEAPAPGCPACPGLPHCAGAPADYVARFGRTEIDSETGARPQPIPQTAPQHPVPPPPPRAGRAPATRLRFARRQAMAADLGGDPTAGDAAMPPPPALELALRGSSRQLRQTLVRLAQEGAPQLRLTELDHPDLYSLLRDALRLNFDQVELHGDLRPLAALDDRQLFALRRLHRVVARGPQDADALAQRDAVLSRISRVKGVLIDATPPFHPPTGDSAPEKP